MEISELKKKAFTYLENAKNSYNIGDLDNAVLNIFNFFQSYLNYKLKQLNIIYPQTTVIRLVIRRIGKVLNIENEIEKFIEENISTITLIEDIPIRLSFLRRKYSIEEIDKMIKFAEKLVEKFEQYST